MSRGARTRPCSWAHLLGKILRMGTPPTSSETEMGSWGAVTICRPHRRPFLGASPGTAVSKPSPHGLKEKLYPHIPGISGETTVVLKGIWKPISLTQNQPRGSSEVSK